MSVDLILPKRLKNRASELTDLQMVFLDCYLMRIGDPKVIFRYLCSNGKNQTESNTMMAGLLRNSDATEYLKTRRAQLEVHFGGKTKEGDDAFEQKEMTAAEIQATIVKKVLADLGEGIKDGTVDYRSSTIIEKAVAKALDYDVTKDDAPEPPRIYLPENCLNCRYRIAIEETDDTIDECKCCRYRKDDLERGIEYDYKTQLDYGNQGNS